MNLPVVLLGVVLGLAWPASRAPVVASRVIVVRHAERASATETDPHLSAEGKGRALALDSMLRGEKITAIYVTPYLRTQETAAPLAARLGLTPRILNPADVAAYAKALADSVDAGSGVILIISHSNTIPVILQALGGEKIATLCESAYSNLFTVIPGHPAAVIDGHYGAPDRVTAGGC